jgi:dTDP-4-dehydrorhamnose 3,5-epimerase
VEFEPLSIPDVIVIRPRVFGDARGSFFESWEQRKFAAGGIAATFVQDNHSRSVQHTLRGLHYQIEQPQGKLVRVVSGCVLDVAVDLRRSSPTYGRWVAQELSAENRLALWVPSGFAHGFIVRSATADFLYKCTDFYAPHAERCIRWDDPDLAIDWGLPHGVQPLLSAKDAAGQPFQAAECFA